MNIWSISRLSSRFMKSDSGWNRLQCRIFAVAVDRAMIDAAIFEILDEIRGDEALADSAFAVDDES
jgi:hypothetical protein